MTLRTLLRAAGLLGLPALCVPITFAGGTTVYSTAASFESAVSSGFQPLNLADFESITSGTTLANGSSVGGGVSLSYTPIGGSTFNMDVVSGLPTTSGSNYLGAYDTTLGSQDGDDAFSNGDQLTLTFAQPESAVGLYLITAGPNDAGDFTLSTSVGSGSNSATVDPAFSSLEDGGTWVYFLGLVDTTPGDTFTSATLTSLATPNDGEFIFNVDDLVSTGQTSSTTSVPDGASTFVLLLATGAGLLFARRLQRC